MVDKVLKTAIFEQKEIELKFENNDLKQIVQKVLSTMKLQFEKYNALIEFDCKGDDFLIESDIIHLTNVVYNLIENALKYSKNPQITINLIEEKETISLTVMDNGLGIAKEYQSKVFDKFFRVPQGDVHDIKGYGLGLSYVKSVVEKHNGTITVESEINQGSTFKITLFKA
jgi:signal transduction histidine kinase